jgi:hypothetical protein
MASCNSITHAAPAATNLPFCEKKYGFVLFLDAAFPLQSAITAWIANILMKQIEAAITM